MKEILLDGWHTPQLHPVPPPVSHRTSDVILIIGLRQAEMAIHHVLVVYYV
jgi:hypothetical protein